MPWVSRSELARQSADVADLRHRLDVADARYSELLDRYHDLKVSGAREKADLPKRELSPVVQAIAARLDGQPRKLEARAAIGRWVAEQRAQGIPDDAIALQITQGVDVEDGVPL